MNNLLKLATVFIALICGLIQNIYTQPPKSLVEVVVTPVESGWTYRLNERPDFEVKILKNGQAISPVKIHYQIGLEQMPPEKEGEMVLEKGVGQIQGIEISGPGFVRCQVRVEHMGKTYTDWGTAGISPELIMPTVDAPQDFDAFWNTAKEELAKIPIDARLTLMPELCTADINVYHVSLQNVRIRHSWSGISRFYGTLSMPKKPGKYPAILHVPGAGIRAYGRDDRASQGVIVLKVGIHGIPVNLPQEAYQALATGALAGYQNFNLEDKNEYYYRRVYMGCVRAVDFIYSMSEFDGENLAVTGGSQGGALSIISAGLDKRIKYVAAFYPAMSDMTGYLKGRAGGWPHMFRNYDAEKNPYWVENIGYYDVVNFAKKVSVPGWYSWGYNDHVCPPTSMHAAYNSIPATKEFHPFYDTKHWTYPEQRDRANDWLMRKLKKVEGSED